MRVGVVHDALAQDHDVDVLVVHDSPPADRPAATPEPSRAMAWLADSTWRDVFAATLPWPSDCGGAGPDAVASMAAGLHGPYAQVVVCRARLAPFVLAFGQGADRPRRILDLDDDEVGTRRRLAALARVRSDAPAAVHHEEDAAAYERFLAAWLPWYDEVWLASAQDRVATAVPMRVVPNAVEVPTITDDAVSGSAARDRLLFVGNLTYAPNVDAACRLAQDLLPDVTRRLGRPVRLDLVGRASAVVQELGTIGAVTVHGQVDDLTACYDGAPLVVVPLRAGGGTRIKVLEALAHGCEVVATPMAVEGLDVAWGRELVVVDDDLELLATACAEALGRPVDGDRVAAARSYVRAHHDRDRVVAELAAALR
jgi:glycosyltransferase involved in cell wall biosynthesis